MKRETDVLKIRDMIRILPVPMTLSGGDLDEIYSQEDKNED